VASINSLMLRTETTPLCRNAASITSAAPASDPEWVAAARCETSDLPPFKIIKGLFRSAALRATARGLSKPLLVSGVRLPTPFSQILMDFRSVRRARAGTSVGSDDFSMLTLITFFSGPDRGESCDMR
jgi:hypothetical protein